MAAPDSVTIKDLTGNWVMNKSLSGDTDSVLALQGIGWLTRKAIGLATVTQHLKQYFDEKDATITHIDFSQTATGGIKGTTELRTLDYQWRPHSDHLFGDLKGRSRWIKLADLDEANEDQNFLRQDWLPESAEGELVESYVENDINGWTGHQVWGFQEVEVSGKKERRHVRNVVVRKAEEVRRIKLVFDWAGKDK
ncbi:hypothetical protein AOQ84DRAFT_443416 [Glonium stellatum]|uniref:Uncharacterized protein n=1 Tax=Glonium stellatum TaxID=574774 RepID=A0A8E2JMP3_9PEZI|nr:hypothetical protein AOQ84DRAFT_443416 [Glonium stellatum]